MFKRHQAWQIFYHNTKRQILMGAILDVTELLKEPSGMVGAVVIIIVGYFFVKWVFAEPEDEE
ncbi:MAG: hypothetical protein ABGX68_00885 [Methylococcales bacterium]|jgi:hypothetical protein